MLCTIFIFAGNKGFASGPPGQRRAAGPPEQISKKHKHAKWDSVLNDFSRGPIGTEASKNHRMLCSAWFSILSSKVRNLPGAGRSFASNTDSHLPRNPMETPATLQKDIQSGLIASENVLPFDDS